jgi:methyltransferase
MIRLALLFAVVFGAMLIEARRAARNERVQLARGGVEPKHDVYPVMQVAYPGVFLAMLGEGLLRAAPAIAVLATGALLFAAGKLLKWSAIAALGPFWTFRVIVVPGTSPVNGGPYRYLRHPNYVGVIGELVGVALMAGAPVAGSLGTIFFGTLMALRVRVENRALGALTGRNSCE